MSYAKRKTIKLCLDLTYMTILHILCANLKKKIPVRPGKTEGLQGQEGRLKW